MTVVEKSLFQNESEASTNIPEVKGFSINKKFAKRYDDRKRREELQQVKRKEMYEKIDPNESDETSESEDDIGEQLSEKKDSCIENVIQMIKNKDPRIYKDEVKFYSDDSDTDDEAKGKGIESTNKEKKPVYVKDLVRTQLLNAGENSGMNEPVRPPSSSGKSYVEEQSMLKQQFTDALSGSISDDSDDSCDNSDVNEESIGGLFTVKHSQNVGTNNDAVHSVSSSEPLPLPKGAKGKKMRKEQKKSKKALDEEFLQNFISQRQWEEMDSLKTPNYQQIVQSSPIITPDDDDDKDMNHLDATDDFERQYNFRFEQDGGAKITGHSRTVVGSLRRKKDKRKKDRAVRAQRKEAEKAKKREQIKRLKNLKRKEIESKLKEIENITGTVDSSGLANIDLEGDWDPAAYDKQMNSMFNDEYYECEDSAFANAAAQGNADDSEWHYQEEEAYPPMENAGNDWPETEQNEDQHYDTGSLVTKKNEARDKFDELYKLDYEDIIGDTPVRFHYRKVEKQSFGLSSEQIMQISEKDMKQLVSLKKLAPYRTESVFVHGEQRRKFLKKWREAEKERAIEREKAAAEKAAAERALRGGKKRKRGRGGKKNKAKKEKKIDSNLSSTVDNSVTVDPVTITTDASVTTDVIIKSKDTQSDEKKKKKRRRKSSKKNIELNAKSENKKKPEKNKKKPEKGVLSSSRLAAYGL